MGGDRPTARRRSDREALDRLLAFFPTSVSVPPLRLRLEDLPPLVTFFLAKLGQGGHVTCSPEAMRLLMRSTWPGNVRQLQHLLHEVVQHRRAGAITAADLPPEMHSVSRRVLSPLESMERDAIVRSLADADGNKVQAARALGHVAGDDLPQDPRVRDHHRLTPGPAPTEAGGGRASRGQPCSTGRPSGNAAPPVASDATPA